MKTMSYVCTSVQEDEFVLAWNMNRADGGLREAMPAQLPTAGWLMDWSTAASLVQEMRMASSEHHLEMAAPTVHPSSEALQHPDLTPWEALLTVDGVIQRLRLGRPSRRYLQLILTGVAPIIHAEALLWFPRESELPFCGVGKNLLTEAGCARLIALISREHDWKAEPTYLCNHAAEKAWHREFQQVRQLLAIYVADTRPLGWVVAVNKGAEKGFRHSDAALLAPFASLVRLYDQSVSQAHEMQQLLLGFARSLTAAIDAKDPRRAGHSERTARIAVEIARQLSLPEIDLGEVYLAGLLHDIGKIGVPEYLFHKTTAWSTQDWQQHLRHTQIGYSFLADLPKLRQIALAVLYHHEHYDGSGYPDGLQSEAIPILARIIAVADAYDAWSTGYWDRSPVSVSEVEKRLLAESGSKWDPQVVQALLAARDALLAIRPGGVGQSFCQHVCQTLTVSEPGEPTANQSDVEACEI
jgi:HD-GYP domain-containing protein (c-di-GMP phosphodiesterase class II)